MADDITDANIETSVTYPPLSFRVLMTVVLAFYLYCLALIISPDTTWRTAFYKPLHPFLSALGIWQSWNVFAPMIRTDNFHLLAVITYKNGVTSLWEFPRQDLLTGIEQMRAERYRKWVNDRLRYHEYSFLLPDAARYIARLHNHLDSPPAVVELMYFSAPIPPPDSTEAVKAPAHTQHKTIFVYQVEPGDLK